MKTLKIGAIAILAYVAHEHVDKDAMILAVGAAALYGLKKDIL